MPDADQPGPIWARPEPGSRRPRLSRAQLAATALRLADAEGFAAVSMRRLAAELGAAPMSLYHYMRGKEELVELMDDALLGEALLPAAELPADWRAALTAIARRTRDVYLRHPWALQALQGEAARGASLVGPNALRHFEQSLQAVAGAPLATLGKLELLAVLDDYVMGHVLRAGELRTRAAAVDEAQVRAAVEYGEAQLRTGLFPRLAELAQDPAAAATLARPEQVEARFERGLRLLLDGAVAGAPPGRT